MIDLVAVVVGRHRPYLSSTGSAGWPIPWIYRRQQKCENILILSKSSFLSIALAIVLVTVEDAIGQGWASEKASELMEARQLRRDFERAGNRHRHG